MRQPEHAEFDVSTRVTLRRPAIGRLSSRARTAVAATVALLAGPQAYAQDTEATHAPMVEQPIDAKTLINPRVIAMTDEDVQSGEVNLWDTNHVIDVDGMHVRFIQDPAAEKARLIDIDGQQYKITKAITQKRLFVGKPVTIEAPNPTTTVSSLRMLPSDTEKDIKNREMEFCVLGAHRYLSVGTLNDVFHAALQSRADKLPSNTSAYSSIKRVTNENGMDETHITLRCFLTPADETKRRRHETLTLVIIPANHAAADATQPQESGITEKPLK